jgi:competence protein ComEC
VRDEIPASIPLAGVLTGLVAIGSIAHPSFAIAGLLVAALLATRLRGARGFVLLALFAAAGLVAGAHAAKERARDERLIAAVDRERFAAIEANVERDWSQRGSSWMLRVDRFRVNGHEIRQPLRIYTRFEPPTTGLATTVKLEGFLRSGERGLSVSVKSPRLIAFSGTIDRRIPAGWNRLAAQRTAARARDYPEAIALIEAIVLGRGERLSDSMRQSFRAGGTYHLLVFSGLQISFAAAIFAALLRWLRVPRISDWLLLVFALLAPFFIGGTASVSRASLAIALYAISRIAGRPTSFENLWCLSALIRLLFVPGDLLDPGFQLTYAGAGALLFVGKSFAIHPRRWIAYALAAEIVLAPLTLFHFHQFAAGGSIATLLMTPVIFAILVLSAVFCIAPLEPLLVIVGWLGQLCDWINHVASSGTFFFMAPAAIAMVLAGCFAIAALVLLRGRRRAVAVMLAMLIPSIAAIVTHAARQRMNGVELTALDVGQGDSILLRDSQATMLVDGGGRNEDARFGESTLLPLLVDRGVSRVDVVVLSHAHPDHCGGLPAVLAHLDPGELWLSPRALHGECAQEILESAAEHRVPIRILRRPTTRVVGTMRVTTLLPSQGFRRAPENNSSVVLRVEGEGRRILLTGDLEREGELDLLDSDLRASILKVPHHGSRSSTIEPFLERVAPRIALISCGRDNLFHHPHDEVIERLDASGVHVWRTDRDGSVTLRIRASHVFATAREN